MISIHAPRRGSDCPRGAEGVEPEHFNPRSPQGERLDDREHVAADQPHFNPRSPQGERLKNREIYAQGTYFNPRSPQGERRHRAPDMVHSPAISIHAPRRGSDYLPDMVHHLFKLFQSTLPAGGATAGASSSRLTGRISIHAPRRGSDLARVTPFQHVVQISIHAPRRGSDGAVYNRTSAPAAFQSTLPAGGATMRCAASRCAAANFNPRSPQGERLNPTIFRGGIRLYFNPRSPQGERLN